MKYKLFMVLIKYSFFFDSLGQYRTNNAIQDVHLRDINKKDMIIIICYLTRQTPPK